MATKTWSQSEAAEALRISTRHVRNLTSDGVLPVRRDGRYDPLPTALAYLAHTQKDAAGKQARTELAQVEAARKRLLMRKHLGQLLTMDEHAELDTELWAAHWQVNTLCGAYYYHALSGVVDPQTQLRIAGEAEALSKAELVQLRDRWAAKLKDRRVSLHDGDRIDRLLTELATADPEPADDAP
jgi:hypothetical protein